MGLEQSRLYFDEWSSDDIAMAVAKLGRSFEGYAQACRENGIDGYLLAELSDEDFRETMDDLGITNRLHRRVLVRKFDAAMAIADEEEDDEDEEPAWEVLLDDDELWDAKAGGSPMMTMKLDLPKFMTTSTSTSNPSKDLKEKALLTMVTELQDQMRKCAVNTAA